MGHTRSMHIRGMLLVALFRTSECGENMKRTDFNNTLKQEFCLNMKFEIGLNEYKMDSWYNKNTKFLTIRPNNTDLDGIYRLNIQIDNCYELLRRKCYHYCGMFTFIQILCKNEQCFEIDNTFKRVLLCNIRFNETAVLPYITNVNIYFNLFQSGSVCKFCTERLINMTERCRAGYDPANKTFSTFLKEENSCVNCIKHTKEEYLYGKSDSFDNIIRFDSGKGIFNQNNYYYITFPTFECLHCFRSLSFRTDYMYKISFHDVNMIADICSCYKVTTSSNSYVFKTTVKPPYIIYIELILCAAILIVNSIVITALRKKESRSPATLLLSLLAFTDTMTALLITVPDMAPYFDFYDLFNGDLYRWWSPEFPYCIIYMSALLARRAFHFVSVLITMMLCLQKTMALCVPILSKIHLKNRFWSICLIIVTITSVVAFSVILFEENHRFHFVENFCFFNLNTTSLSIILINYWIYYCSVIVIMTTCTVYLTVKLACPIRSILHRQESAESRRRKKNSACIVILICIVFLFSEFLSISFLILITISNYYDHDFSYFSRFFIFQENWRLSPLIYYVDISLMLGFAVNFIIYILMGDNFRHIVFTHLLANFRSFKNMLTIKSCRG